LAEGGLAAVPILRASSPIRTASPSAFERTVCTYRTDRGLSPPVTLPEPGGEELAVELVQVPVIACEGPCVFEVLMRG
jgi:hypothetical protein